MALSDTVTNLGNAIINLTDSKISKHSKEVESALSDLKTQVDEYTENTSTTNSTNTVKNIGEIVASTLPLADAGLHLLDGALIVGGGIYDQFVDYIAKLYNENPTANYFAQAVDAAWTQPALSANGTMGGDSFTVSSNIEMYSGNDVYNAFDNNTSTQFHSQSGTTTGYIDMYNPTAIKITNIKITNQAAANRASSAGTIYGSNDGTEWTQITTYTNSVQTASGTWNIDLSSNTAYYKHYRMESTAGGTDSYWTIAEIALTAYYQQTAEETWQATVSASGVCGKFVYDSSANTVRLPKITGILEGTTDVNALGDLIKAGLPNITGTINATIDTIGSNATGAFYQYGSHSHTRGTGNFTAGDAYMNFNASRSSSVYGNSSTVQPQTIKVLYYIVIATSTKTDIQVDLDNVATDLNNKVDKDGTNATFAHITESYVNGTSGYNVYSNGYCIQWGRHMSTTTATTNLLKTYKDTDFIVLLGSVGSATAANDYVTSRTQKSITLYNCSSSGYAMNWYTAGYIR